MPNLNIKGPNLKSGINLNIPDIEGNIPGIDKSININFQNLLYVLWL